MAHGRSICRRCAGLLVRDMFGVWYHDGSQAGVERFNDDDHAPEPQKDDLIAIRRIEQQAARAAALAEVRGRVIREYEAMSNAANPKNGECECGLPMDAHCGGFALLNHDRYMVETLADRLAIVEEVGRE